MPAPTSLTNASLLALLTAAITSCASTPSVNQSTSGSSATGHTAAGSGGHLTDGGAGGPGTGGTGGAGGTHATGGSSTGTTGSTGGDAGFCGPRRPFLIGSSLRTAPPEDRADWSRELAAVDAAVDPATAALLAQVWLSDGLEEHASVAAFARFTMHLLSVGAPPELVEASQRASLDEIRHARACFALAGRYGGRTQGPAPLVVHDSMGEASLAEIAALTAEEGCIGETLGAALAVEQLAGARDPEVRAILQRIVTDEARHAELAWRFVKWATLVGGPEVERAVRAAVERGIEGVSKGGTRSYAEIDLDAWHAHGRLTCVEARAAAERAIREVVRPCLASVFGGPAAHSSSVSFVS